MLKSNNIIGNRIKSPYFNGKILIVTSYYTDKKWKFKFEKPRSVINDREEYWAETPYSYFEKNNLVLTDKNKKDDDDA